MIYVSREAREKLKKIAKMDKRGMVDEFDIIIAFYEKYLALDKMAGKE